ncbi:MAG: cytochrome b5 domain-containing protein [Desulfatiglandales bacterium]|jgi:predicted heme/steroid binding protein/uncharacterized membrane protein|nr:cytochrome b5 domain-containing protein [Desulfatiglandales bacterium]
MKEFDLEEISKFNGEEGSPTYIVHKGRVIDVSESALWKNGLHMKRHRAGNDLTTDIQDAPHGTEVLEKYPQIGVLKKKEIDERVIPEALSWLLARIPMLRHHPHPMTVHFPIVFMFSTTIFNTLYLITRIKAFELTALHSLGAGILFTPVAILTGLYTWWLNYLAKPVRAMTIKQRASIILFFIEVTAFIWRIAVPDILDSPGVASVIYFLLVISMLSLVTIIGWFGAQLTFPIEQKSRE